MGQLNKVYTDKTSYHMISKLSHELRTPLTVIYSNLQLLNNYKDKIDRTLQQEAINLSFLALNNIIRLLDNISIFNKSNNDSLTLQASKVKLKSFTEKITDELNSFDEYKNRIIAKNFIYQDIVILDEFLVEHALSNILNNALKYSDFSTQVQFNTYQFSEYILFVITDQGIGLEQEETNKIFNAFYRGKNVNSVKGNGLGLNIAKRCIEIHGGKILLTSKINEGTTVKIYIPYEKGVKRHTNH